MLKNRERVGSCFFERRGGNWRCSFFLSSPWSQAGGFSFGGAVMISSGAEPNYSSPNTVSLPPHRKKRDGKFFDRESRDAFACRESTEDLGVRFRWGTLFLGALRLLPVLFAFWLHSLHRQCIVQLCNTHTGSRCTEARSGGKGRGGQKNARKIRRKPR